MTLVGKSQVEHLVSVLPQRLNLHTGDTVKQAPELPVPRRRRCTNQHRVIQTCKPFYFSGETRGRFTWVSGYRTGDPVVAVEQLPPEELISGNSQPLPAGQTCSEHGIMGQTQEDLQHQAVRQNWATLHPNILHAAKTRR